MRVSLGVFVALGLIAAPASAAPEPAAEKKICKRVEAADTGSNIRKRPKRVCRTELQWKEIDSEDRQKLETMSPQGAPDRR